MGVDPATIISVVIAVPEAVLEKHVVSVETRIVSAAPLVAPMKMQKI